MTNTPPEISSSSDDSTSPNAENTLPVLPASSPTVSLYRASWHILKPAVPFICTGGLLMLPNVIATRIFSELNDDDVIAASGIFLPYQELVLSIARTTFYALPILFKPQENELPDRDRTATVFKQGLIQAFILSLPCAIFYAMSKPLLFIVQQNSALLDNVENYLTISIANLPADLSLASLQQISLTQGKYWLVLLPFALQVILNATLGYVFTLGKFGFPAWGMKGYAWASVIATNTACISYLIYFRCAFAHFFTDGDWRHWATLKKLLQLGLPIGGKIAAEVAVIYNLSFMAGLLDDDSLIAQQVGVRYIYLFTVIVFRLSQPIALQINNLSHHLKNQQRYAYAGIGLSFFIEAVLGISLCLAPDFFTHAILDKNNPDYARAQQLSLSVLPWVGLSLMADALRNAGAGVLRGLGDTITPMWLGVINAVFFSIPLSAILAFAFDEGIAGVFLGRTVGLWAIGLATLGCVWRKFHRMQQLPLSADHANENDDHPIENSLLSRLSHNVNYVGTCLSTGVTYLTNSTRHLFFSSSSNEETPLTAENSNSADSIDSMELSEVSLKN